MTGERETEPAQKPEARDHEPITVAGVDSCNTLAKTADVGATRQRLPALTLPCLTPGADVDLSELGGRSTLVNLWATWCRPCRDEMPLLQENYQRYAGQVAFVGVNTQDDAASAGEFTRVGVTYPQVVDVDGDLLRHLRIPGLPVTVLLDENGEIAAKHIGELDQESLDELLRNVAAGQSGQS